MVLEPIHDCAALVAEGAARLVGVVHPSVRLLVLKEGQPKTDVKHALNKRTKLVLSCAFNFGNVWYYKLADIIRT